MKFQIEKPTSSCDCKAADTIEVTCPHCKSRGLKVGAVTIKAQLKKEF